ncbi:Metallo-dependent hydrolase [Venustampulla echinocandica]|uniref:adenosine deaminase n=1 Tax=Venustampulla echinocandica TaxID=2656787 RepID=A0A370TUI1_9HELO|nr:Metallo-dependent hydrolase [Venustampulla echinocandica]RDL39187.1 Metallo-dependent hydrolase [Venustampulla echinocandica]
MEARIKHMDWPSQIGDDEWKEVSEGLPSKEEPFIWKYVSGREALIAQEKKQRSDYAFRQSLSPLATRACEIVSRIRDEEQRTIWTGEYEDFLAREAGAHVYPGMMFGLAKERMEKTKLWKIVRNMPKGALLHAHMDAMVDFDYLFDVLLETKGMHIYCDQPLATKEARDGAWVKFRFQKKDHVEGNSIWSPEYEPSAPILLTKAADAFPNGGRPGFISWLKSRCTITCTESCEHHHGVDAVWRKFSSCFGILNTIVFYEPIFRLFMRRMMVLLLADGVKWVDLRLAFAFRYYREGSEEPDKTFDGLFKVFGEEIEKFKASEEGKAFWGARMIWTGLRAMDTRKIVEDMDACIGIKLAYPHLISGYDLVGQEDAGRPLKDLLPELFWFKKQCAQEGIDIPFFFHAGECLGDGNDTDQNLFDAVLLGTRRIGHGYSIYKHPLLIDMVKEKKILVESCPISNEILRLCNSVLSHPLPALLARGVACALCNDDPAILGQDTAGMTHDFWQALQGWDNLGLAGLGSLAENSVRWAAFEDQTNAQWLQGIRDATLGTGVRAERMMQWSVEWEQFCLWIVTEFDDDAEVSDEGVAI